jgi:hypothetical protein
VLEHFDPVHDATIQLSSCYSAIEIPESLWTQILAGVQIRSRGILLWN